MHRGLIIPLSIAALLVMSLIVLASCGTGPVDQTTTTSNSGTTGGSGTIGGSDTTGGTTGDATQDTVLSDDGILLAASPRARISTSAPRADILAAADAVNAFGADLYSVLAQSAGDGNVVFSPASIETALTMTYAGAKGDTATEMAQVLHLGFEEGTLHPAFNSLDTLIESRSWQGKNAEGKDEGVLIKTANSLWGQQDLAFERLFLDTLAKNYGAGMRLVDYKTAAEEARQTINEWVAGQTEDKIRDLIPQGALDALTRLVLVNAVYLDATWASQFDKEATRDGTFTTLSGTAVTTAMMNQTASFRYGTGDGWQAVELPYARNELAMLLIVPDEGRFAEVETRLRSGLVPTAADALSDAGQVRLTMPKFEFRTQAGLAGALQSLGMEKAFDDQAADFSGMTTQEPLVISDVIHEAYIAVDEEGTEAAAATAVIMRTMAMPAEPLELTIDRPFLFALHDKDTGAILFLGRVTDPTA